MQIVILIIAKILALIFFPIGMIYTLCRCKQRFAQYCHVVAVSIDQMANVIMQDIFNDFLIKNSTHFFGDEDETISSVLGKNLKDNTLTVLGGMVVNALDYIDPNHVIKNIEE